MNEEQAVAAPKKTTRKAAAKPKAAAPRRAKAVAPVKAPVKKSAEKPAKPRVKRAEAAASQPAQPDQETPKPDRVKDIASAAADHTLAINPLIGLRAADFGEAAQVLFGSMFKRPDRFFTHWTSYITEMGKVLAGQAQVEVDAKDKRFADTGWKDSRLLNRTVQAYTLTGHELRRYIEGTDLNTRDKQRAQFIASIYLDAIAPSNTLAHPAAWRKALETRGESLLNGVVNLVKDWRDNGGLPASVDRSKFKVGGNVATSEGAVVFRNEVLELIQYVLKTEQVFRRPLLVTPPQVNKFYALDLAPDKSVVQFCVKQGIQLFAISWRNPGPAQRDWSMSTYVQAVDEAVDAVCEITGSPDVSMWGACSGGITAAAYIGWLAATKQEKVANIVTPVCTLNPEEAMDTALGLFVSEQSLAATKASVKARGVVDGGQLAKVFAWMRPNDLIWNYWVNNYLLGNDPPAFDVLFWNADTTRLPAAFHADLIDIVCGNGLSKPGAVKVLGEPIDMRKAKVEAYVVAGITDHITPWKSCYPTARLYGPRSVFTLANAGHLQSILNPPGAPKAFFYTAPVGGPDADQWAAGATRVEGSWWPHWMAWLQPRSREQVEAPKSLGSKKHPPGKAAPGEYVFET